MGRTGGWRLENDNRSLRLSPAGQRPRRLQASAACLCALGNPLARPWMEPLKTLTGLKALREAWLMVGRASRLYGLASREGIGARSGSALEQPTSERTWGVWPA